MTIKYDIDNVDYLDFRKKGRQTILKGPLTLACQCYGLLAMSEQTCRKILATTMPGARWKPRILINNTILSGTQARLLQQYRHEHQRRYELWCRNARLGTDVAHAYICRSKRIGRKVHMEKDNKKQCTRVISIGKHRQSNLHPGSRRIRQSTPTATPSFTQTTIILSSRFPIDMARQQAKSGRWLASSFTLHVKYTFKIEVQFGEVIPSSPQDSDVLGA